MFPLKHFLLPTQKKYFFKYFLLLFIFSVCTVALTAQQPVFRNYNAKDGLPSNEVYCAFQDSKGFIWFGTDGGVSRFDGYTFKNYTTENGLVDNTVFEIREDRHGRIWFRSLSGKLCYWHRDSIYAIGANDSITINLKNSLLISFYIDEGDTVWCGLRTGKGYYKIMPGYTAKDFSYKKLPGIGPFIIEIGEGAFIKGGIYGTAHLEPVRFFRKNTFLFSSLPVRPFNICYEKLGKDTFLVSDDSSLVLMYGNTSVRLCSIYKTFHATITFISHSGKAIYVGTRGQGIYSFILTGTSVTNMKRLLDDFSVSDRMPDNEGGTWYTTLDNGIYYLSPDHFVKQYDFPAWLFNKSYSISLLDEAHIAFSKDEYKFDLVSSDTIIHNLDVRSGEDIRTLCAKVNEEEFFILKTGNIFRNFNSSAYAVVCSEKKVIPLSLHGVPIAFYITARENSKSVYLFDRFYLYHADSTLQVSPRIDTLPVRTLTACMDKKGVLWLGCLDGLWSYHNHVFSYHGNENPLLSGRINDIKVTGEGAWIFALSGKGIVIRDKGKYTHLTVNDGLPSNNCECIFIDSYGMVWVGTKNGICTLGGEKEGAWKITKYNPGSDVLKQRVSQVAQTGNKLWVLSDEGVMTYDLPARTKEVNTFPVLLTRFSVNNMPRKDTAALQFLHNENDIQISYVALSYHSFGRLHYKYKLDGLDTAWSYTDNISIHYPFLPPGNYTFYVKAFTLNGMESVKQASIHFIIAQPFWKTGWFTLICIVSAVTFVILLFYYRLGIIRKKEEKKTRLNKQVADIEMKALRAQMNPHFIFNAINSIQNYILKNDRRTAQDYLAKFARLIRNVLENSKSEFIPLVQEIETLGLYIELEQLRMPGKFTLSLQIDTEIPVYEVLIPPLLLQPFVENAIQHGLLHLQENKGLLQVIVRKENEMLVCVIEDNGIGRKKAAELRSSYNISHRSMGISVTEERLNIINRLQSGMAGIAVEDKTDNKGNAAGTKVTVSIPYYRTSAL